MGASARQLRGAPGCDRGGRWFLCYPVVRSCHPGVSPGSAPAFPYVRNQFAFVRNARIVILLQFFYVRNADFGKGILYF